MTASKTVVEAEVEIDVPGYSRQDEHGQLMISAVGRMKVS
jgi:hypothetical protein